MLKGFFKSILLGAAMVGSSLSANAIIANSQPVTVKQPDGSEITISLRGDEFCNYNVTSAGYTVVFNTASKAWEYATLDAAGNLVPVGETASNTRAPRKAVKGLRPTAKAPITPLAPAYGGSRSPWRLAGGRYDYSKFRGLVILVDFSDVSFLRSDAHTIFNDMVNKKGFNGFLTDDAIPTKVEYTGSVHDYYSDNTNGRFQPKFDVVGPVKINKTQLSAQQTSGAQALVKAALAAADSLVNYKNYDTDADGRVDMVYFIFAGAGSNFSGNNSQLIWPHASTVVSYSLDGVSFGRYACSTELYGSPAGKIIDGIGTICHEFSHVLGLSDLYDTDYSTNGQSNDPGDWSVMAGGSYNNRAKTPVGYSLFERYTLGFATPRVITEPGSYSIAPLTNGDNPDGCIIKSSVKDEYFTLENRIRTRWDLYLPGTGMLIHRVDSTKPEMWDANKVNAYADHNYYELIRANPKRSGTSIVESDGDPFPGSGKVTEITNSTTPALRSWAKVPNELVIKNIAIDNDKNVTFTVIKEDIPVLIEDFSTMAYTNEEKTEAKGKFTTWTFAGNASLANSTQGKYAATVKGASLTAHPFEGEVETVTMSLSNPNSSYATFKFSTSDSIDGPWTTLTNVDGTKTISLSGNTDAEVNFNIGGVSGKYYRLEQATGSLSLKCRVQRILFTIKPKPSTSAVTVVENPDAPCEWYTLQGARVDSPSAPGVYIRRQGTSVVKVLVK